MRRWELRAVAHQGHVHGGGGEANVTSKTRRFTWVLCKSLGTMLNTSFMKAVDR